MQDGLISREAPEDEDSPVQPSARAAGLGLGWAGASAVFNSPGIFDHFHIVMVLHAEATMS